MAEALGNLCANTVGDLNLGLLQTALTALNGLPEEGRTEAVHDAIRKCITSHVLTNRIDVMLQLQLANPQALHNAPGGSTLAHHSCENSGHMLAQECIDVLEVLLLNGRDAFTIANPGCWFPIHLLARHGPVEALEYLLDACPEVPATTVVAGKNANLLHCVLDAYNEHTVTNRVAKARLLCTRYPAMMLQRQSTGCTPLFIACCAPFIADVVLALCEAGGREVARTRMGHPTRGHLLHGMLPLHAILNTDLKLASLISPAADAFRLLLRLYPEAAGVRAGMNGTPYQRACERDFPA